MKKIFVYLILLSITLGNACFSYDAGCKYVNGEDINSKIPDALKNNYDSSLGKELLTEKGLQRALRNLKKYCCFDSKEAKGDKTCKKADFDDIKNHYPKSSYLFNHILSVMVRRLDSYNYEGVDMDEKAAEWLKFVNEFATKPEGALPTEFTAKYKEYRLNDKCWEPIGEVGTKTPKYKISTYDGVSAREYKGIILRTEGGTSETDETKYKKLNERDLSTKYLNLCQTALYLTMAIGDFNYSDQELYDVQNKCFEIVNQHVKNNTKFFEKIMTIQGNRFVGNIFVDYKDHLRTRYDTFITYLGRANTYRGGVLRMIQQITQKCN